MGAGVGAGAWVVGLILAFLIGTLGLNSGIEALVNIGTIWGTLASYVALQTWFVWDVGGTGSVAVFTLVPIILLVASGFYVASQEGTGYMAAAGITAGYFVLALLSILGIIVLAPTLVTVDMVDMIINLIVAGIVFPAIFAGIGGAIADAM